MAQMIGNELNTLMMLMSAATRSAGRSSGRVTSCTRFHGLAPSIAAASYSSAGTVCSPASTTYVVNGTETKMATKIIAGQRRRRIGQQVDALVDEVEIEQDAG